MGTLDDKSPKRQLSATFHSPCVRHPESLKKCRDEEVSVKSSHIWLAIGLGSAVMIVAFLALALFSSGTASAEEADVNLETLTEAYATYVRSDAQDLSGFEARVNQPDIYSGTDRVSVSMDEKGTVIGYVEDNGQPGYQPSDSLVFNLEAEKETESIVANDRQQRYYSYRAGDIFSIYLISRMMTSQHAFYGGRSYRAPASARYVQSGYHQRLRSASGSRSARTGSYGAKRTSGGSSGFGK